MSAHVFSPRVANGPPIPTEPKCVSIVSHVRGVQWPPSLRTATSALHTRCKACSGGAEHDLVRTAHSRSHCVVEGIEVAIESVPCAHEVPQTSRFDQLECQFEGVGPSTGDELLERARWAATHIAANPTIPVQATVRTVWETKEAHRRQAMEAGAGLLSMGFDTASMGAGQARFSSGERTKPRRR